MTAMDRMIDANSIEGRRGSRRAVRIVVQITSLAAAFTLGFLAGLNFTPRTEGALASGSQDDATMNDATPSGSRSDAEVPQGAATADELLRQLDLHQRELADRQRRIESSAKEDRIAYSLLRMRGFTDDSIECERLINRQKQMHAAAAQVESRIAEVRQLQRRLSEVLDGAEAAYLETRASDHLLTEIQQCLSQSRPAHRDENVIPDERWDGGPDLLMQPDPVDRDRSPRSGVTP